MQRKWVIATVTMVSVAALAAGFSMAADEDSPLHKLMEDVNAKNLAITKAVRTEVAYKKASKDKVVQTSAEALADLAKKARAMKEGYAKAKDVKEPEKQWNVLWDDFDKQTANLVKVASDPAAKQAAVKSAHGLVKKSCSECHTVFRIEEE